MKPISKIKFGFSDAENYRRRENKDIFNRIFLRTEALEKICERNVFFLVGEKGTGKTAYAVYLSNSPHGNNRSIHKFIRETDYHKFIALRRDNQLGLSDYTDIWKVIIYLLLSDFIFTTAGTADFLTRYTKFGSLKAATDEYYENAFDPEIPTALQFVENSTRAAELISKHFPIGGKLRSERKFEKSSVKQRFQLNLLALEKYFENALSSLRLNENHMLFVDGIDIRPDSVPYEEYLDCVKGLANAVWSVNNDFFPSVRDSEGRLRVALLVRPDIFNSLGLQNRNTKLRDNAVVLDWKTTYEAHRTSNIFKMADQMFSAQQDHKMMLGVCWDHYFPFHAATVKYPQSTSPTTFTSFIVLLRYSFHRPRDILTILDILKEMYVVRPGEDHVFQYKDLFTPEFRRAYGEYALGEIKDSLSFYYDASEFDSFLKFFEYLEGRNRFTYEQYIFAYDKFLKFQISQKKKPPEFMKSPQDFLQFLYELNIICFIEDAGDERFIRWCFIERTASNISPKVKSEMEYEIHYGLANALNTGKPLRGRRRPDSEISTFPLLDYAQPVPTQPVPPAAEEPRAPVQSSGRRSRSTAPAKREHSGGSAPTKRALGKQSVQSGVIKWFDARKSYGFIIREDLPFDIYFARSSVMFRGRIRPGQHVEFEIVKDGDGRITATNVRVMSPE